MNRPLDITQRQVRAICEGAKKAGCVPVLRIGNAKGRDVVARTPSSLFVVREKESHRLVGLFVVPDDGVMLAEAIDQNIDPGVCEYAILRQLDMFVDEGPNFPPDKDDIGHSGRFPWFGDLTLLQVADLEWQPVFEGWVYFLRVGQRIKIGHAINVENRLKALQTGSPEKIEVVMAVLGGRRQEERYHARFNAQHERGEWFRYEGALKEFLLESLG